MAIDKSKWCVMFLRRVRRQFYSMQSKKWYKYLVHGVDQSFFAGYAKCPNFLHQEQELAEEARTRLAEFLLNFTHLNLPDGAELGVAGFCDGIGGEVYLTICWPGHEPIPVSELPYDHDCVESVWEREVLCWVSSQFFLWWHAGYSQCVILLGDASRLEREIKRIEFYWDFIESVDEMDDETRRRYLNTDFSPRVESAEGKFRIVFHIFSPFGGIFQRIAGEEPPDEEVALFPYCCGINY